MRRSAIQGSRPLVSPVPPAASLDGTNPFARFACTSPEQLPDSKPTSRAPAAPAASSASDRAATPEEDEDGWIDCSASGKISNFERARNIQKAILAKRRRESYQQHKERIKKRLKQENELEEDGDGDGGGRDFVDLASPATPAKLQPLPLPSLAGSKQAIVKSTLIRNTLLDRSLDDYDPLADQLARNKPKGRVSVYDRMGKADGALPRNDLRPFSTPVRQALLPTKAVTDAPDSFFHQSAPSSVAAPKPREEETRAKRRVVVFSDDDTDLEPPRAAAHPPANQVHSKNATKVLATIDLSDDLEDTPVREKPNGISGLKKVMPAKPIAKMAPLPKNGTKKISDGLNLKGKLAGRNRHDRGEKSSIDDIGASNSDSNDEEDTEEAMSENDIDEGEEEESSESSLQRKAKAIIRQCEDVSARLQEAIRSWDTTKSEDRDCVNLTSMASAGSKQILTPEDIATICPGLRLNPYQVVGVNWLKLLLENDVNGVLADDMGLGKTVQTIAFLSWLLARSGRAKVAGGALDRVVERGDEADSEEKGNDNEDEEDDDEEESDDQDEEDEVEELDGEEEESAPHLIVVPASTLNNWRNEIEKFNPSINFFIYHGSQAQRQELRHELRRSIRYGEVDVILTTYTLFERETNKPDRSFLCSLRFDYLVLDEAHCIKNSDSLRYAHLNALQTQHRLLLSGTPVQNNLSELLALLSFLMPTVFRADKCQLLIQAFGWTHSTRDKSSSGQQKERQVGQLKGMLAPFVLRRLKVDVLDQLSTKQTQLCKLAMTPRQQVLYDQILTSYARKTAAISSSAAASKGIVGQVTSGGQMPKGSLVSFPLGPVLTGEDWTDITREAGKKVSGITVSSPTSSPEVVSRLGPQLGSPAKHLGHCPSTPVCIDLTDSSSSDARRSSTHSPSPDFRSKRDDGQIAEAKVAFGDEEATFDAFGANGAAAALPPMTATEAKHLFTTLRKAANHPLLLRIYYQDEAVLEEIAKVAHVHGYFGGQCTRQRVLAEIKTFSDFDLHQLCTQYPALQKYELTADTLYDSPKMLYLREHLPLLVEDGHRMLIFSQWTRILDLLEVFLEDMGMGYLRLDGSTAVQVRQELIDTFNSDTSIPIFLLSTKAGGLGINLTAADTVILHDLDFNPENDKQAEDRCHRIGQTKPVTVYKLVASQSVDEDIYEMGERKSRMSHAVLSGGGAASSGAGKGRKAEEDGDEGGDDIAVISKILSKALLKYSSGKAPE